jgi:hypothetical protein
VQDSIPGKPGLPCGWPTLTPLSLTRQLGTERDALPALASITGVEQDCWLAHNPALITTEGDGVEAAEGNSNEDSDRGQKGLDAYSCFVHSLSDSLSGSRIPHR